MLSSCGGSTNKRKEASGHYRLTYSECWACGRCGNWRLTRNGFKSVTGEQARVQFNAIAEAAA